MDTSENILPDLDVKTASCVTSSTEDSGNDSGSSTNETSREKSVQSLLEPSIQLKVVENGKITEKTLSLANLGKTYPKVPCMNPYISPYKTACRECGLMFSRSESLTLHMRRRHFGKPEVAPEQPKNIPPARAGANSWEYKCGDCARKFFALFDKAMESHMVRQECVVCKEQFMCPTKLNSHMRKFHVPRVESDPKLRKKDVCEICGKSVLHVKEHLKSHSSERTFKCDECPEKFYKNQASLLQHIRTSHLNIISKFPCPICGKIFGRKSHVKTHLLVHEEKKCKCNFCDYRCTYKQNMKAHLKSHEKVKE